MNGFNSFKYGKHIFYVLTYQCVFFARKAAVQQCIFLGVTCECCLFDNSCNWLIFFY